MHRFCIVALFLGTLSVLAAGCQRRGAQVAEPDVPSFNVAQPVQAPITESIDYTGRTNARDSVTIQPRVTGYLMKMPFKEGDAVKAGDLLFEIDARPYEAQYKAALAAVSQNEASVRYAQATNKRFREAFKKLVGAVSERELDQYQAQEEQAVANLDLAKANLESAKLNLEWCVVKSPIDGLISRYYLTIGNLVNQDVTQLTTVVSMDPMYVYFDMDEPTLFRIKQAIKDGRVTLPREGTEPLPHIVARTLGVLAFPQQGPLLASSALYPGRASADMKVEMALPGDEKYGYEGTINFFDNQVNPGTGSISVRGRFDNPKLPGGSHLLAPGMFVRVRLPIGEPQPELLVIDKAVVSDQGLKYLYVLDAENKPKKRRVAVGSLLDNGLRVITQGLKKGDWVLIGGLQQVRETTPIRPVRMTMPTKDRPAEPIPDDAKAEKAAK